MTRNIMLLLGVLLLIVQQYIWPAGTETQFVIFLAGIVLLGIPHGAADLLVASKTADTGNKAFSSIRFLAVYIGRLMAFAAMFWFFPVAANIIFIFIAAYHFGETDLHQFKTDTFLGKLFVISYGLLILSVILLHHFEEVIPLFQMFDSGKENSGLINWILVNRYTLMSAAGIFFFTMVFVYFLRYDHAEQKRKDLFLIRLGAMLFILYNLPMLLGFTFYFVIWHSVLSLGNIVSFLKINNRFSNTKIVRQIIFYSTLALAGIGIFGLTGFMFSSTDAIMGYLFLGLAVLTAPHLQIMHEMYHHIRNSKAVARTL